jgi:nucleotide-binding universal stress UspA family protein
MRILLAADGSEDSRGATEWLCQFPVPASAKVLAVTVAADPTLARAERSDLVAAVHADSRDVVEAARRSLAQRWPDAEARVLDGDPRSAIIQACEDWRADLAVVGSRGLGAIAGMVLGSVSIEVARNASCAVLITKGLPRPVHKALVAVDGSANSLAAARWLAALPLDPGAGLRLVAVAERPRFPTAAPEVIRPQLHAAIASIIGERTAELEKALGSLASELSSLPWALQRAVVVGSPADAIVEEAKAANADLVVVGARGLGAFDRLLLGSVSERVIHDASCSVLIVKRGPRAGERDPST